MNGENIALIPGTNIPVSINNVHQENHQQYFHDNEANQFPNFEADGFTDRFKATGPVIRGTNVLKMAIADTSDCIYDSWVIIEGGSLRGTGCPSDPPSVNDRCFFRESCSYGHETCCDGSQHPSVTMTCEDGMVVASNHDACSHITCTRSGKASGDPHLTTWSGEKYDFQ